MNFGLSCPAARHENPCHHPKLSIRASFYQRALYAYANAHPHHPVPYFSVSLFLRIRIPRFLLRVRRVSHPRPTLVSISHTTDTTPAAPAYVAAASDTQDSLRTGRWISAHTRAYAQPTERSRSGRRATHDDEAATAFWIGQTRHHPVCMHQAGNTAGVGGRAMTRTNTPHGRVCHRRPTYYSIPTLLPYPTVRVTCSMQC